MATKYRKVDNCGRVPYPDRSGKFLEHGEVVEGDDWAPFVALGFVVPVEDGSPAEKTPAKIDESKTAILKEEEQGVSDVVQNSDVGSGTEAMDSQETGESSDESVPGRSSTRRRR